MDSGADEKQINSLASVKEDGPVPSHISPAMATQEKPLPATASMGENESLSTLDVENSRPPHAKPQVMSAQDWIPDDQENPMNWPTWRKSYYMTVIALQAFVVTFGTSVYTPATVEVAKVFKVSHTVALLPLSVYVLGLAFGPAVSAPVSETWGRRPVYIVLFPLSLLFSLGASLANNFATLIVCRFLGGLLGSGCLAVGSGSNADMFAPIYRAPTSVLFILSPFLGPAFGPPIGAYAAQYKSWRWPLYVVLMAGAVTTLATLPMKETSKKIILKKRAKKLNLPPPPDPMPTSFAQRMKFILLITLARPVRMLFTEPIVAFLSIYTAFNFAVLFAFFATFPVVFLSPYPEVQVYHFSLGESGLVFLAIAIGCFVATLITIVLDRRIYVPKAIKRRAAGDNTPLPPEERMIGAMVGCFFLPVGLFWFAWSARSDIHWIVPVIATIPFGLGNLMVFTSTMLYLIDTYGALGGASAAAANGILRYIAGAVFPLFMVQMTRALGVGWTVSIFGFITVILCPLPWILYKYGHEIRARSAYI